MILWFRSESNTTCTPDWATDCTSTCTASTFLTPWLLATARYFRTSLLSTSTLTSTCCICNNYLVYKSFVKLTTEGSFGNFSALCASLTISSITYSQTLCFNSWFNDHVATSCARYCTFDKKQVTLSINAYDLLGFESLHAQHPCDQPFSCL